ncbi:hypothetical protein AYO44_00990 [Planctomycetaceae bacterium SCGC AG-212-F19]|nr:hypothetical protein AYO44_00990 [Planctomycetaceae bacterium SCGC AG-212-F19]
MIAWARFNAPPVSQSSDAFMIAAVLMALGFFFALMGTWLFLLAIKCRGMYMEAGTEGLHLTASLYEWFLWNPWGVRKTWLRWDEIKGLRLWPIPNKLAPGGVQKNYVLYTTQGTFVLSNAVWPHPERMVAVIAEHTGLPTARSVTELPAELAPAAQPSRKERRGVLLLRGMGWAAIILGWLVLAMVLLVVVTGQEWKGSLGVAVLASLALVIGGYRLRRFRLE